ncbi:MAG: hypothetical protein MI976_27140, partial [Pseudomonadales bacterium]|nr:hypothetical protein [Pseudomonadales bacterium]
GTAGANTLFNESANISLPKVVIIPAVCVPFVGCTPEVAIGPLSFNLLSVQGTLTTLSFDELEIDQLDLNSGPGWEGLSMDAQIRDVDLGVQINTDVLGLSSTVEELLDALNLDGKLDFLAGDFTANISVNRLRLAADIGLNAVDGDVNLSVVDIAAVGLGDLDSDFVVDFSVPQAIRDFGFGLLGKVIDIIEAGISGARDLIVELLLGKLVPLIVNLALDPLVNELQVRLGASINNGAFLTVFVGVQNIDVVANNTLKMTLNGRIGTETASDDSIDIGLDLGFPDILNLDDHLLPDLLGIPEGLGAAPGLVPTMLGSRYSTVAVPDPDRFRATEDELGISISSNLINQALLAIYEAGILSPAIPIWDDRGNSGAYFITDIESANERILFLPKVAPELTFRGQQISVAYLTLDHFEIQFQDLVNATGDDLQWQTYATYELNSELAVKLSDDAETGLKLGLINPEFDIFYEIYDNRRKRLSFPTSGLLFSSLEPLIVEQINGVLMQFLLPESLTLTRDDAALEITPSAIETVGVPREHFGISAILDSHTDISE